MASKSPVNNQSHQFSHLYRNRRAPIKKWFLCIAESRLFQYGVDPVEDKDKAVLAGPRACLPPKVKSQERTARAAWAGWGGTQAPRSETES